MSTPTLGHHTIGDCLWYTAFENSDPLDLLEPDGQIKQGKDFKTHERFLGLVTFLHESVHFLQDYTLGICAWVCWNADRLAIAVHRAGKPEGRNDAPGLATAKFAKEQQFLHQCLYSSEILDRILDAEIHANPSIAGMLEGAYGLTGEDLLECHAAILTEWHIARLIRRAGGAFDSDVLEEMASYFRPESMPSCQKALRFFREALSRIRFDKANRAHPLYPHSSRAAEYGLLLFLLDFALHTNPLPEAPESYEGSRLQDSVPAARFLKLVGSVVPCILHTKDPDAFSLHEEFLHTSFMQRLASHINYCNDLAAAFPSQVTRSFLLHNEVSALWVKLYTAIVADAEASGLLDLFDLFHRARIRGMARRQNDPLYLYRTDVTGLAHDIGIYPMFSTKERVSMVVDPFLTQREAPDGRRIYDTPVAPHTVMDTHLGRLIFLAQSESIAFGKTFCCPVAAQYDFYPCPLRADSCKSIAHSAGIPECFARQVWSDFYCGRTF